jgi:hypothetical protein
MKKAKSVRDELRPVYRREDFGTMTRGKYADRCHKASNVVVIAPELQKVFPSAQAVNDALRGLIDLAKVAGLSPRPTRSTRKGVAG